jgi:hypothetical protein
MASSPLHKETIMFMVKKMVVEKTKTSAVEIGRCW